MAILLILPVLSGAKERLGLGVNLGEPLGFNARFQFTEQFLGDLILGYGFEEEAFIAQPSLLFALRHILDYDDEDITIVPYFGAGFKTGIVVSGSHDGEGVAALRFPVGSSFIIKEGSFEASIELAPGIELNPNNDFDFTGGLGLRYYFF